MQVHGELSGRLTTNKTLRGSLSSNITVNGALTIPPSVVTDYYDGEYNVTPRLYEQTLATSNKVMRNDVSIYEIPVTSTTNPHGGKTVVIG